MKSRNGPFGYWLKGRQFRCSTEVPGLEIEREAVSVVCRNPENICRVSCRDNDAVDYDEDFSLDPEDDYNEEPASDRVVRSQKQIMSGRDERIMRPKVEDGAPHNRSK